MENFVPVAQIGQIPPGAGLAVSFSGTTLALFKVADRVHAVDDACPLCGASLAAGKLDRSAVTCGTCTWKIDVQTGRSVGVARIRNDRYAVRILGSTVAVARAFADASGKAASSASGEQDPAAENDGSLAAD
jgi:nitrite reductase/ring-hydroxylating ferredoxin subunit